MSRGPDALVVGAGPAGASAALRLARRGFRVLLVDAASFPRSKPCGDCLSPGATPLLEELGLASRVAAAGAGHLRGWATRAPGGRWFTGTFGGGEGAGGEGPGGEGAAGEGPGGERAVGEGADGERAGTGDRAGAAPRRGLALPRAELDALLVEGAVRAGAGLRERTRVRDLVWDGGEVRGVRARDRGGREIELRARVVVGADGLRSVLARRLAGVRRGPRRRLALVGRFAGVAPPEAGEAGPPGPGPAGAHAPLGEMRIGRDGVLGLAPLGGRRWNATLVVPRSRARAISADRCGFFREKLGAYGVADRFAAAEPLGELEITGPFEVAPRRTTAPGLLLTGDAAGYFDPLTGQGIHRALATGRAAAAAAAGILEASSAASRAAVRAAYEGELTRIVAPGRRVQRLVDGVVSRPAVLGAAARLLDRRPGLASLLVDVTGDRLPPRALVDPRRLWRALGPPVR